MDDSNSSEIIPIYFNTYSILEDNRDIDRHKDNDGIYLIQTCSQAKTSRTKLPEVYRIERVESKPETRKATCNAQTRHIRKAVGRSGKSRIEKKKKA